MGLAAVNAKNDSNLLGSVTVNIVVNGNENVSYGVTKPSDQFSGTATFNILLPSFGDCSSTLIVTNCHQDSWKLGN